MFCIETVGRERDFPALTYMEGGKRHFTNDMAGRTMVVFKPMLEHLISYHAITFTPLHGYYWLDVQMVVHDVIRKMFALRREYKAAGNPMESVIKLMVNSAYGKSIMKPILDSYCVMRKDAFMKKLGYQGANFGEATAIGNDRFIVHQDRDTVDMYSVPQFGALVLEHSKIIMDEVFACADAVGAEIFYTDTDSLHLFKGDVPRIAAEFRTRFGRELIGKNLGQFHTSFPAIDGEPTVSTLFIGVGKKTYYDRLEAASGAALEFFRMKGVPEAAVRLHPSATPETIYRGLYAGRPYTFDLLAGGRVSFAHAFDGSYRSRPAFTRTLCFPAEDDE